MPKVSIVLPTYNGSKYIRESINSVIEQTYSDWELIIVNDCSTDDTPAIINQYVNIDKRIHVINNVINQKLPMSLNMGFRIARGEYLTWTSDDNMYCSNAIEKMTCYLDEHTSEKMVCAKIKIFSSDGNEKISEPYVNELMPVANKVGACFLYRRCVLRDVGEYDKTMFLVEDYEYWFRIYLKYKSIGFIDDVLYLYRKHEDSLTATKYLDIQRKNALMKLKYIREICECLSEKPDLLCRVYFHIYRYSDITKEIKELVSSYLSVLNLVEEKLHNKKCIVYGAGNVGSLFYKQHSQIVSYFADKNIEKVGTSHCGIEIISVEQMARMQKKYNIVLAAGLEKIYDFLCTLDCLGIKECFVYQEE